MQGKQGQDEDLVDDVRAFLPLGGGAHACGLHPAGPDRGARPTGGSTRLCRALCRAP